MLKKWLLLVLFIVSASCVCAAELDPVVEQKLDVQDNVSIIISYTNSTLETKTITEPELIKTMLDKHVDAVVYNYPISAFLQDSVSLINASEVHTKVFNNVNLTGMGETVCLIDTGVYSSHSAFNNSIIYEACYCSVSEGSNTSCCSNGEAEQFGGVIGDNNGHGTHVAGIIASNIGVAPSSKIVSVKVLNSTGSGQVSDLINAIDFCNSNRTVYNITVISGSLGTSNLFTDYCDDYPGLDILRESIDSAISNNISVVFATGNSGSTTSINAPACMHNVTSVAATTKLNLIASYSNRNSMVDLVAPGSLINSTYNNGEYYVMSGTSMAAPHVVGVMLLLRQYKHFFGINLSSSNIENLLKINGTNVSDSGTGFNFSLVNVLSSLEELDSEAPRISILSPLNTTYNYNISLLLNYSADDAFLRNVSYSLDGNTNLTLTNLTYYNVSFDGLHNITVYANDSGSRLNASTIYFTVNTSIPLLNITNPVNNTNFTLTNITLNFTTSSSAYSCFYSLDGVANLSIPSCANITLTSLNQGSHNLTLYSKNYFNESNSRTIFFYVDSLSPLLSVSSPINDTYQTSRTFVVNWTVNDTNYNHTILQFYNSTVSLRNDTISYTYDPYSYPNYSFSYTSLSDDEYRIIVTAYDYFGNSNSTIIQDLVIDNVIPRITEITVSNSNNRVRLYVDTNENAYCSYSVDDDLSYALMTVMSSTGGTSHSNSITYSSSTDGMYYIRCKDYTNNTMASSNETNFSITVSSSGNIGGTGGSGGSGSSGSESSSQSSEKNKTKTVISKSKSKTIFSVPNLLVGSLSDVFVDLTANNLTEVDDINFERNYSTENNITTISSNFSYTGNKTLAVLVVYEKIPKSIAVSIENITFSSKYYVVKDDPEIAFIFENVSKGMNLFYSYNVKKNITVSDFFDYSNPVFLTTNNPLVAADTGFKIPELPQISTMLFVAIAIILVLAVVLVVIIVEKSRKKK